MDITDSPFVQEDFIWRGLAEEIKKLILVSEDEFCIVCNRIVHGAPGTYIRVYYDDGGIKTTIFFGSDTVDISYFGLRYGNPQRCTTFELTDPKSLETLISWLRSHHLVSESAQLGDAHEDKNSGPTRYRSIER